MAKFHQDFAARVKSFILTVMPCAMVMLLTSICFSQQTEQKSDDKITSEPEKTSQAQVEKIKIPDLCKDAIDPFRVGIERKKFFRDAGKDNEMTEAEFNASLKKDEGFARKFDRWAALKSFDKDKNGQINWLEAERCRRELRRVVLKEFDTDRNGHLTGKQRDEANKALFEGKLFAKGEQSDKKTAAMAGQAAAADDAPMTDEQLDELDPDDELTPEQQERISQDANRHITEMLKKFDTDGDMALSSYELRDMIRQQRSDLNMDKDSGLAKEYFDFDDDGEINDEELSNAKAFTEVMGSTMASAIQFFMDTNADEKVTTYEFAAGAVKTAIAMKMIGKEIEDYWDDDQDGKLSPEENEQMQKHLTDRFIGKAVDAHDHFDYDGDGILDDFEREDMSDYIYNSSQLEVLGYDRDGDGYLGFQEKREYMLHLFTE